MLKFKFQRKITVIILIFCLIIILSYYLGFSHLTTRYITILTNPMIATANYTAAALSDFLAVYLGRADLSKKNDDLNQKIIELVKKNVALETLRQENEWLKKELKFLDEQKENYLLARVLGRNPDYAASQIIINQGLSQGLKPGLAVTTDQGIIIGKISSVEENISHVRLLNDNTSKIAVSVMGDKSALGIAQGLHNINLAIDLLPKDIKINENDLVVTSGLEENIPAGLIIGRISKIETTPEKYWQEALVEPAVDYQTIRLVTIIIPKEN